MVSQQKSLIMVAGGLALLFILKNGIARKTGRQIADETKRAGRHATDALDEDRTRFQSPVRQSARNRPNRVNYKSPMPRLDIMEMS